MLEILTQVLQLRNIRAHGCGEGAEADDLAAVGGLPTVRIALEGMPRPNRCINDPGVVIAPKSSSSGSLIFLGNMWVIQHPDEKADHVHGSVFEGKGISHLRLKAAVTGEVNGVGVQRKRLPGWPHDIPGSSPFRATLLEHATMSSTLLTSLTGQFRNALVTPHTVVESPRFDGSF
ncbi:hypothetical protein CC78DRAFT_580787 [Lojkania enalia]|uniref:Uncharacterized protein n=1 Tax=Lojkania enalia TaxID=147567 RepID=A0A9P4MZR8_9PLEO|nr:hypothetical protein CC78DRAFT_580787 [Didymosphaeria enalia]